MQSAFASGIQSIRDYISGQDQNVIWQAGNSSELSTSFPDKNGRATDNRPCSHFQA
jgi:hypothetical protein